ncbi:MAG: PEP-CTERM sorting domain-containing protein [Nitrospiraceae bacterium]
MIDFSYSATVNQVAPAGTCSAANPCTFTETGNISFSTFRSGFSNDPVPAGTSGLNLGGADGHTLTGTFTGSGTAVPFGDGIRATFNTFDVTLNSNGNIVGQSTGLTSGEANVFGPALANGDFKVVVDFQAQGGYFGGLNNLTLDTSTFAGNNTNISGVSLQSFTGATIQGSGNVSFTSVGPGPPGVIPEPSSILLLGSGLAGLGWFRRRFLS